MPKEETATRTRAARSTAAAPKRKKDPNAPKRPLTAYLYYANEQRDSVRKANPEMTFGKVHSLIGDNWKKLTAEKKKPYEELAAKDKQRYEDEKAAYNKKE